MKTFLLKDKRPICKWGQIPDNIYFEGELPENYSLAICPNAPYVILDIDDHKGKCGFDNIPFSIKIELSEHFAYQTNSGGQHIWLKYTGNKELANKTSGFFIDLRTHNGYVKWYLDGDIRNYIHEVKETSLKLNNWLEQLFSYNESKK
jgi:hypothetical protein